MLFTLKAKLLVENLTFHLFPGRFYGFDRSETESHCPWRGKPSSWLRTELVCLGTKLLLSSHGSLGKLLHPSVPQCLQLYVN